MRDSDIQRLVNAAVDERTMYDIRTGCRLWQNDDSDPTLLISGYVVNVRKALGLHKPRCGTPSCVSVEHGFTVLSY